MVSQNAEELSACLDKLSSCEVQMAEAERECEIFHAKKTQDIFEKRREILRDIPKFWYIVLAQCEDFAEWMRPEDLKYTEQISDIYVRRDVVDPQSKGHYRDFSVTIQFQNLNGETGTEANFQTVTKKFFFETEEGKDVMYSEPVAFEWPSELLDICPALIRANKKGEFSKEERKKYRQGMRSFFAWFEWTGRKPGKEFRGGEDLTSLITEEIFPNAVNFYVEAMNSEEDSNVDSSEGEELDVSDEEEEEPETKKQKV